ncbi:MULTISPECIES: hypothetical protein [Actinomadura]|uniref:Matrixin family metalloprotease n=1 Tax=Actinomadura miaoliensis TaxID=430685 RepID=A0ABP7WPI7_9ACTN
MDSTRHRRAGAHGRTIAMGLAALAALGALVTAGPAERAPAPADRATPSRAPDPPAAAGTEPGTRGSRIAAEPCPRETLRVARMPYVIDMTRCDPRSALLEGPNGLGAVVPADGSSVAASSLGTAPGESMRTLVVRVDLARKLVVVSDQEPGGPRDAPGGPLDASGGPAAREPETVRAVAASPAPGTPAPAVAPIPACKDAAYRRDGAPLPSARRGRAVLKWWYYPGDGRVRRLSVAQQKRAFTLGVRIAVEGRNNCRLGRIAVRQSLMGHTWRPPGVISSGACGLADGRNVRGWMRFDQGEAMLGLTCKWFRRGKVIEGDVALNASGVTWTTGSGRCRGDTYDAVGVAAHENLHHMGLAHVDGAAHRNLTMFPAVGACEFHWRTLGRGDFLGLKRYYGTR